MSEGARRICSLLPSATEILYALGVGDRVVAVTHECDYPPQAREKPHLTSSVIPSTAMSPGAIDQAVRDSLADGATIYHLDRDLLAQLQPDLLVTQELCDVCAVGPPIVKDAVASLKTPPEVVSLEPTTLDQVIESILYVGSLVGASGRASDLVCRLRERLDAIRGAVAGRPVRRVLTLEWVDPVFIGGHWVPDQVQVAGGEDVLGRAGTPSREATWTEVAASNPDVVVAMPCGFGLERSEMELMNAPIPSTWHELPAVRAGEVYVVDGSSFFNRPGPRLVDGVEILAHILHPEAFDDSPPLAYRRIHVAEVAG